MKRWMPFLLIFCLCFVTNIKSIDASPIHVAVIQNYDEISGVQIVRAKTYEEEPFLYEGDLLIGENVKQLNIETYPYTEIVPVSENTYKVVRDKPMLKSLFDVVANYMGFVTDSESILTGVTRDRFKPIPEQFPQPGYFATLLDDQLVNFKWSNANGSNFVLLDSVGKIIYSADVKNVRSLNLNLKDLGLKTGETYSWKLDGRSTVYKFKILDNAISSIINRDLNQIDSELIENESKKIKKAAYLQLMSDTYSDKIDLYWLSYQFLLDVNTDNVTMLKTVEMYKKQFKKHHDNQIYSR